jgi:hypothetical protein
MWHCAPMADGAPDDGPPLEMPSLSLRRRRKAAGVSEAAPQPTPGRGRRHLPTTSVSGLPAAAVTGVVVGGLAVLLAWLAGVGCETVRGTSACGGGPGLLILVVVVAVLAWAGSLLLRLLGVPHAGSTSVLAVGVLAVLVLVFLLSSLDEWWALVAVPLASVIAYASSWWVTTAVGEEQPSDTHASYDVR